MHDLKSYNQSLSKRILIWLSVILFLVLIPTVLAYYAIYKYLTILENDNLNSFKLEKQRILGIASQATDQNKYLAQYLRNELIELSSKDLKYEDVVEWLENEQKRLNFQIEFATQQLKNNNDFILGKHSNNIQFNDEELTKLFNELIPNSPYFYYGDIETYYKISGKKKNRDNKFDFTRKYFGNLVFERSFEDLISVKDPSIIWGDTSKNKTPFASYVLPNCAILIVFKPDIFRNNSILKGILNELCNKNPNINTAFVDFKNGCDGLWLAKHDGNLISKLKYLNNSEIIAENFETDIYELNDEYVDYNLLNHDLKLAIIGKKFFSIGLIRIYSFLGAILYLLFMLPFIIYTQRTIVKELPGKASIRLKLFFLLWFATGIPLITMTVISQEHYQNKRLIQLENVKKMAKNTIQNYDKKFKSYTKKMSFRLNTYFSNWAKTVKKLGFDADLYQKTHDEIYNLAKIESLYVIATGPVIANYCGYIVYDGEIDHPKINYEKSKINWVITPVYEDEYTQLNIIAKKIMFDLNHEKFSEILSAKLEIIVEALLSIDFTEIINELMAKIREIKLWGFYKRRIQTYFNILSVYDKDKYDYTVICFWPTETLQKKFLDDTLAEVNRDPTGIKILPYNINKSCFYTDVNISKSLILEFLEYKQFNLKEKLNDEIEYIKIRNKPYALLNLTEIQKNGKDVLEYEKKIHLESKSNLCDEESSPVYEYKDLKLTYKLCPITDNSEHLPFSANMYPLIVKDDEKKLNKYIERLANTDSDEFEIMNIDGKEYVVFSAKGVKLDSYNLVILYPLNEIEQNINVEKNDLLMFILFSILYAISISQLLAKSLITPLNNLRNGVTAIQEKKYDYIIENIGNDEFGEVSRVFNKMLVGLSELEKAKIVQESLFPKENFQQNNFVIYGKSVAMSGVGGDYFDYFTSDESNFAVLMGDVAGHGIGAAIIMAMAKSGILCNKEYQNAPKKIISLLHSIILKAKSVNQRKVMTFQYMYCNSQTGECLYANAGACSPFIYRKSTDTIEELKLLAPVLGGFKKSVFNEIPVNFEPGDAIVFYTDGLVESRNEKGIEVGYSGLKTIIKASYDKNPAVYYQRIYNTYLKHIEGVETQDDITIVIAIYKPAD